MKPRSMLLIVLLLPIIVAAATADDEVVEFMTTNCYACHDPKAAEGKRIAPPMIGIKRHYLDVGLDREAFIDAVAGFVAEPAAEKTKMPGAVRRFGVMPLLAYDDAMIRRVAAYIHDNEIEQPEWFEAHWQNRGRDRGPSRAPTPGLSAAEKGQAIANATKAQLGKNLLDALNNEGAAHAVAFCNEQAIPLTTAMEDTYGTSIHRVSDRPRNPANAADDVEAAYIARFQTTVDAGQPVAPLVIEQAGVTTTYLPIVTNAMCLQCHGVREAAIAPDTLARIQALYPDDRATGYGENQVRGLWRIRWDG